MPTFIPDPDKVKEIINREDKGRLPLFVLTKQWKTYITTPTLKCGIEAQATMFFPKIVRYELNKWLHSTLLEMRRKSNVKWRKRQRRRAKRKQKSEERKSRGRNGREKQKNFLAVWDWRLRVSCRTDKQAHIMHGAPCTIYHNLSKTRTYRNARRSVNQESDQGWDALQDLSLL